MLIELKNVAPKPIPSEMIEHSEVWGTDLKIEPNSFTLISAHSGKGKSTLFHLLYGIRQDYTGEIIIDGQNIHKKNTDDWMQSRCDKIALLFQELKLFPLLTAQENINLIPQVNSHSPSIEEMADRLGMKDFLTQKVANLSYGQRQRIALIRVLRKPFQLLLLDEPFSHLDQENEERACSLIEEVARTNKATFLLTSLGQNPPLSFDQILSL